MACHQASLHRISKSPTASSEFALQYSCLYWEARKLSMAVFSFVNQTQHELTESNEP